jgi:hypothetical protein
MGQQKAELLFRSRVEVHFPVVHAEVKVPFLLPDKNNGGCSGAVSLFDNTMLLHVVEHLAYFCLFH